MRPFGRAAAAALTVTLAVTATPSAPTLASDHAPGAADYPPVDSGYHSYSEMAAHIASAAADHPGIVRVFSIGRSHQGREIWAAEVSDNVGSEEDEPEVLFDGLHHAREHLSAEQAIAILDMLTYQYGRGDRLGRRVTRLVDSRRIWIVFMVNPDGLVYDLSGGHVGGHYRHWRKNRQPTPGSRKVGTDLNRNYAYGFGCCGGSSGRPGSDYYRGQKAWSAPETRALRDFVQSRVRGGRQRITAHISFHTAGEQVLWPYAYTLRNLPPDMTALDQRALRALGRAMAAMNGYRPMQSSDLYISDGDMIDWMYATQRVFSFTFELYPRGGGPAARHYPPDRVIRRETKRNRKALVYLIEKAACPYAALGATARRMWCGPFFDDLEIDRGWRVDPEGADTATVGLWSRGTPVRSGAQPGLAASGQGVLVTGRGADRDVDGGHTTVRSPRFRIPADGQATLHLSYWVALGATAGEGDGLRVRIVDENGARIATLLRVTGTGEPREATWRTVHRKLPGGLGGLRVAIELEAADDGSDALVEAAVDDVRVTTD